MANDLVPSGDDANIVVGVDSRGAIAGLNTLEARMYGFVYNVQNRFNQAANSTNIFAQKINNITNSMSGLLKTLGGFIALRTIFNMVEGFLSRMIEVNRQFTGFIASMSIIRGSVGGANKEYEFLLSLSNKLGVSVETSISQYHRLAAALKNVDKDGTLARNIFSGISQAAVVLHSRGRDVTLIFEAVQQMASKGKLSLEELQRQLGNTLPGAMGIAARAMMNSESFIKAGVKTAADSERMLRQGIQKGTINVYEFLARLSNQLKKEYGDGVKYASDQFTANFNRMKNSVFEFYRMVGSSDAMAGLTELVRQITALFNDGNGQGAKGLGNALGGAFRELAGWVSSLDSTDVEEFFEAISVSIKSTFTILEVFMQSFSGIGNAGMTTPLLDFVEFCARTMAALVDVFRVAFAGIETVLRGFMYMFYQVREAAMQVGDIVVGGSKIIHEYTGLGDGDYAGYDKMRAEQQAARQANEEALGRSFNMFAFGPGEGNTAYDQVTGQFANSRNKLLGSKYGVDGQVSFQVPGVTNQVEVPFTPTGGALPAFLAKPGSNKAGSSADAAAAYVNPLGDYELQKMIDEITANSGAPNGTGKSGKTKKDPAQSNYLKEQTRLLKELAVADNEYQNVIENRNLKEGESEAQMRSLLATDDRYVKLSAEKKAKLLDWAQQVDAANQKVRDAITVQKAYNDALLAEADANQRIGDILTTGYENKYRKLIELKQSFGEGGENQNMDQANRQKAIEAAMKEDNAARALDLTRFTAEIKLQNDELRFQADLYGRSRREQQQAAEFRKIDLQTQQMMVGATAEQAEEYKRIAEILKTDVADAMDKLEAKQNDMWAGVQAGLVAYMDANKNYADNMAEVTSRALGGIEDAFVSMVETGKLSFADLTRSIAKDLVRLIVRYLIVFILQKMTGLNGGGYSDNQSFGSLNGMGNFDLPPQTGSYNGNAFVNGSKMLIPHAKGGVFDQPAMFAMGNGQVGTAFERNSEAIMPLVRDKSGALGVKQVGGDAGGESVVNLTVEVYQGEGTGVKTSKSKSDNGDILKIFIGEVAADIQRGGPVARAMTQTFGVKRSPKSYA